MARFRVKNGYRFFTNLHVNRNQELIRGLETGAEFDEKEMPVEAIEGQLHKLERLPDEVSRGKKGRAVHAAMDSPRSKAG